MNSGFSIDCDTKNGSIAQPYIQKLLQQLFEKNFNRLPTYTSFLCAAKPSKWIVLGILFIIIYVILNNTHLTMYYDGIKLSQKKRVHTVVDKNEVTESEPMLSTNALQVHGVTEYTWLFTVDVHKSKVTFKHDMGAETSVLPLNVYKQFNNKLPIQQKSVKLSAYGCIAGTYMG